MSEFAELRAILLRMALGYTGFLTARQILELIDWLDGLVTIHYSRFAQAGRYQRRADGGIEITLPVLADDWRDAQLRLHETGHGLLDLPPRPEGEGREAAPFQGLASRIEGADERECDVFTDAMLLPRDLVLTYLRGDYPDWEGLVLDSGCPPEQCERRVKWIYAHPEPSLREPAPWSAWGRYRLTDTRTHRLGWLRLESVDGARRWEFPYRDDCEREGTIYALHWALAALRPHEVELKFGGHRVRSEEIWLPWRVLTGLDPAGTEDGEEGI